MAGSLVALLRILAAGFPAVGLSAWLLAQVPASYWQRNPIDPRWVQGQVDLASPLPVVWRRITDVPAWPRLFSDMASFSVKERSSDGTRWVVRLESRTVGHGVHDCIVTLDSRNQSARVVVDALGVRAGAYANLAALDALRSRASYSLFAERRGFFGWFISEEELRSGQERMIQRTLADLRAAFGEGPPAR